MPAKVSPIMERLLRNFFGERHLGGKLNHLVKWNMVSQMQEDGGLGLGGLEDKELALLAKWAWRF